MSWGLEARFPFLDLDWLQLAYSLDPTCKMSTTHPDGKRIEKHILRTAFDDEVGVHGGVGVGVGVGGWGVGGQGGGRWFWWWSWSSSCSLAPPSNTHLLTHLLTHTHSPSLTHSHSLTHSLSFLAPFATNKMTD
jgi:hypothetical protein